MSPSAMHSEATKYASASAPLPQRLKAEPRAETWCSPIDADSMKRINPQAFQNLTDIAAETWGADWDKYYTNPPDYPEDATQACVIGPAVLTFDDSPECTTLSAESSRVAVPDSGGEVNLAYDSGSSALALITVTDVAAFPLNGTVTAQIDLSQIGQGLGPVSFSSALNNSLTSSAQANNDNLTTNHVSTVGVTRQSCFQPLTNVSCTATGRGRIQIAYTGALWFNYPTRRGTKDNPNDTHYKWALFSDAVGATKPQDARSTYISFTASVSSYALTRAGEPRCLFANSPGPVPKPTTKSKVPAYAYAVPIVVVAALVAAAAYYFRRRRQTDSRGGTRLLPLPSASAPTASAMSQVATSWDPSTVYMAPPTTITGTDPWTRRWSSATSAWETSPPAYSEST